MRQWVVRYWVDHAGEASIETWFDGLNDVQFKAVAKELALLKRCGNQLRLPHSRSLGKGLFELRERTFGYRVYYGFQPSFHIVLLHAGDKSDQQRDIVLARTRLAKLNNQRD